MTNLLLIVPNKGTTELQLCVIKDRKLSAETLTMDIQFEASRESMLETLELVRTEDAQLLDEPPTPAVPFTPYKFTMNPQPESEPTP